MKPGLFAAVVVAAFVLGFGVGRTSVPSSSAPAPFAANSAPFAGMPAANAASQPEMTEGDQPEMAATSSVIGKVTEVIQVPNYTYLHLTTQNGEEWAAVNSTSSVAAGQTLSIVSATQMHDFASSTLKRTFATIWFGQLAGTGDQGAAGPAAKAGPFMKPAAPSGPTAQAMAAIGKADGPLGLRVADIFSERKMLSGKNVKVRGLVTKVNAVQGVNYVHVKDGSGTAASGDDDLTVMLATVVKVDEVVTVEGKVAVDKDLGMGAKPVVLEEARIVGN